MLSVYVDDFKMAGRTGTLEKAWDAIRGAGIHLDEPVPFTHYLGCNQHKPKITKAEAEMRLTNIANQLPGCNADVQVSKHEVKHDIKGIVYDMQGFLNQCVDRYCEFAKISKDAQKRVPTPCLGDHQIDPKELEEEGRLGKEAAKILMKTLCCAQLLRFDFFWTLCKLARSATKWTKAYDRRLHRLPCYLHMSKYATVLKFP